MVVLFAMFTHFASHSEKALCKVCTHCVMMAITEYTALTFPWLGAAGNLCEMEHDTARMNVICCGQSIAPPMGSFQMLAHA